MNRRQRVAVLIVLLVAGTLARAAGPEPLAHAQGPQTWQILVNNVSPEGRNWSFNAFYPDQLQAHPGDTIVFTLAPNPQAFHTVMVIVQGLTPLEMWSGFAGGFAQPNPRRPETLQSTFFSSERVDENEEAACDVHARADQLAVCRQRVVEGKPIACGRVGAEPCVLAPVADVNFGANSGALVNPPPQGGQGNQTFTVTLAANLEPGPYYFVSLVDGPWMSGRIDVLPPTLPVQSAAAFQAKARRQYEVDLAWLTSHDRISNPREESNPDGTKTWQADAGRGSASTRLSINEFSPSQMVVVAGDTVVWTNHSPGVVPHTVSGFASGHGGTVPILNPFQPLCADDDSPEQLPPPGSFPPDIWNSCPGAEANNFTEFSQPSVPSGTHFTTGSRTSGLLLNQEYLDSPSGDGLPFLSSYAVTFPNSGTYSYVCAIHPGMAGAVVVIPRPMPR